MAVSISLPNIPPPDARSIVTPVLSALPGAASSTQPATAVLPLLSPILRQRVQLLSSASTEPWIRLLTYEPAKVTQLTGISRNGSLDPHPASGEIELDWDLNVDIRYKRLDQETLQTLVVLHDLNLFFRLVHCTGDPDGGGDGWRVGEVGVASSPAPLPTFGGFPDIKEAEKAYQATRSAGSGQPSGVSGPHAVNGANAAATASAADGEDDDDDDYWARYDATPSRTPAMKRSPAPRVHARPDIYRGQSGEDAYFAMYDDVQPAMDNHDPDGEVEHVEHVEHAGPVQSPLRPIEPSQIPGLRPQPPRDSGDAAEPNGMDGSWTLANPCKPSSGRSTRSPEDEERAQKLLHPRPASSASSSGSQTIARLEARAEGREQSEFTVKQHISRTIRGLFLLSRASGIQREEFERTVRTELDVLGMVEDGI